MRICLIVAASENGVIGAANDIPWHLPDDLKFFKKTTSGFPIIMGRKTWESIGRPLPKRTNIIVTRSKDYSAQGAVVCNTIAEAFKAAAKEDPENAFVIVGGQIYRHSLKYASRVYLTKVHAQVEGDVTFPALDEDWKLVDTLAHPKDEKHPFSFEFCTYEREAEAHWERPA